ncbi:response regulator transcription factor [Occultella glacieicola]|uniref:Response regulator transcription factor n=1 Tax=Occultella glacieicola TaxID=2518684 RepID=A0ABY2DXX9_9MICO|nr:response regulator [Occultella glacieicola]TDE88960.1 response regulator transcription factor [Occultella glacieicola]
MTAAQHEAAPAPQKQETASVLLYSDDYTTRDQVKVGVGRRASLDTAKIVWTEAATPAAVVEHVENNSYDLVILDGEAPKHGGMGLCRTLKSEIYRCPPIMVLIARPQDAWLASWSEADAVVSYPLDPLELQESVADVLRARLAR